MFRPPPSRQALDALHLEANALSRPRAGERLWAFQTTADLPLERSLVLGFLVIDGLGHLNRDFPDDSRQAPKTVAQLSIERKRDHSTRIGGLGWGTRCARDPAGSVRKRVSTKALRYQIIALPL